MIFKTPLKTEIKNGYATVSDADGNPIPELTDIELGWTDTTTGNYSSPEKALDRINEIVRSINMLNELSDGLKSAHMFLRAIQPDEISNPLSRQISKEIARIMTILDKLENSK